MTTTTVTASRITSIPTHQDADRARRAGGGGLRQSESDFIKSGIADFTDVMEEVYERTNEKYGTSVEPEVTQ